LGLSLWERRGRAPAPCGWRRAYPIPAALTATERHYKRTFLPAPLGTPPVLGERQHRNGICLSLVFFCVVKAYPSPANGSLKALPRQIYPGQPGQLQWQWLETTTVVSGDL